MRARRAPAFIAGPPAGDFNGNSSPGIWRPNTQTVSASAMSKRRGQPDTVPVSVLMVYSGGFSCSVLLPSRPW